MEQFVFLWEDHFRLTREYVFAAVYDLHASAVEARLLATVAAQGENLGHLLNNAALGRQFGALLHEHIRIAGEIVGAAIAGRSVVRLNATWRANARQIAVFLAPLVHLPVAAIRNHMVMHLSTTLAEAVEIVHHRDGLEAGDVALFHVRQMALALHDAIKNLRP